MGKSRVYFAEIERIISTMIDTLVAVIGIHWRYIK